MASDLERLAVIEERLLRLAEECGISRSRHDKTDEWKHEHEKAEITRHNDILTAIDSIKGLMEIGKEKGKLKLAWFEKSMVIIVFLFSVINFSFWVYNQIKGNPVPKP